MSSRSTDISTPTRMHLGGMLVFFGMSIQRTIRGAWPIIVIYLFDRDRSPWLLWGVAAAVVAIAVANAILTYLNFTFCIVNSELTVSSGYIRKKKVSIPLAKIQSLNLKQNIVQQLIKIYTLEINTAGTKGAEVKLPALGLAAIREIERQVSLIEKKAADENTPLTEQPTHEVHPILHLSPLDLLKVGITNNHVKVILITFSFLVGLYNDLPQRFQVLVEHHLDTISNHAAQQAILYVLLAIVCAIVLSVAGAVVASFAWFFNLKLTHSSSSLTLEAGLINHKRIIVPFKKIQAIRWTSNPLRQLLGLYSVSISQASGIVETEKMKVQIPGCSAQQVASIEQSVWGTDMVNQPAAVHRSHWLYMRNLWLVFGLIPAALATTTGYLASNNLVWGWIWALAYIPFALLAWKKRYFYLNETTLVASSGSISHEKVMIPLRKIQGISVRQSIWQKKGARASVSLYTAGETITLPQVEASIAFALRDYALYLAESDHEPWM